MGSGQPLITGTAGVSPADAGRLEVEMFFKSGSRCALTAGETPAVPVIPSE